MNNIRRKISSCMQPTEGALFDGREAKAYDSVWDQQCRQSDIWPWQPGQVSISWYQWRDEVHYSTYANHIISATLTRDCGTMKERTLATQTFKTLRSPW